MKDSRIGESLWFIWDGDEAILDSSDAIAIYTEGHIDTENEIVRKALASLLQREGIATSLGDGFNIIDRAAITDTYIGVINGDISESLCDESGLTSYGEYIESIRPITLVEVVLS